VDRVEKIAQWLTLFSSKTPLISVAEPHHLYAAPVPSENFDAAPTAMAPAPTLLYSGSKVLKGKKFT
jgi:hypothetical protein